MALEVTGTRPGSPDPALLQEASRTISHRFSVADPISWQVLRRVEKPTSTLFHLEGRTSQSFIAYYKASYFPPSWSLERRQHQIRRRRTALSVSRALNGVVSKALSKEGVQVPESLAVDFDALATIELEVAGSRLQRAIWFYLPWRRSQGRHLHQLIGRSLRVLEALGATIPVPRNAPSAKQRLMGDLGVAQSYLEERQHRALLQTIEDYFDSTASEPNPEVIWSHGDISRGNILQRGNEIGIIDFSWRPTLACHDVIHFLARLETTSPAVRRWSEELRQEVMSGHGVDAINPPAAFRIAYLQQALRSLSKPHARSQRWGRDAIGKVLAEPWGPL